MSTTRWANSWRRLIWTTLTSASIFCFSGPAFSDDGDPKADGELELIAPAKKYVVQEEFPDVAKRQNPNNVQPSAPAAATSPAANPEATKDKKKELEAAMKGAYKGVFYANDFSYLNDPAYNGPYFFGDAAKGMLDNKLDIGGEYRTRYHHENNFRGLGLTGNDDQFWLTRLRMFANYRVTENIRLYGEYLYADSGGETFTPRLIEENRGEAQNLFAEAKLIDREDWRASARLGRQELLLGEQRLVAPLDWANTRRTFDGARTTISTDDNTLDLFFTHPVVITPATAVTNKWDSANDNQSFYGTYLSNKSLSATALEAYYLGYDNHDFGYSYHTFGSRMANRYEQFMVELEGGVQLGSNSDRTDHQAGFMVAGVGRELQWVIAQREWKPTVWLWYDWASGGDAQFVGVGDNGFHHLFPLAHKYNGFMDLFGRRNLNDVNAQFITPVGSRGNFMLWYHYFFLDQATTPYSVVMKPYNTSSLAASKDLGHEFDLLWNFNLDPRQNLLIGYSHFIAGDYYRLTPNVAAQSDADFFYSQYMVRF